MLRHGINAKYPYILLAAAGGVLAIGLVMKPNRPEPKPQPSEPELAQLRRLTQQRRLWDLSSYLTDAADAAASSIVFVRTSQRSGILWDSGGRIVSADTSAVTPADEPWTVATADGRSVALRPVPLASASPLAAFTVEPPLYDGAARPTRAPDLGDWVLAVARNAEGGVIFAHGLYQGTMESRCGSFTYQSVQSSAPLSPALLGGGAFTLDGQLLGVIAECNQRPTVIATDSITEFLKHPPSLARRLENEYGIRMAGGAAPGIRVISVWEGSRGQAAGIRPGDLIVAADGNAVQSSQDVEARIVDDKAGHELTVERARRRTKIVLTPAASQPPPQPVFGMTLSEQPAGNRISIVAVAAGSSAERGGVQAGDRLLRVGTAPVPDLAAAVRALGDAKVPRLLTLQRDDRLYDVLVEP